MPDPDNVVLQHLRLIREQLDTSSERQLEMIQRLGNIEVQPPVYPFVSTELIPVLIALNGDLA